MTRAEFARGWLLLTAQPWGKAYRSMAISSGEPTPAEIQAEFYFKALAHYTGALWVQACEQYATGDHWPSVDAMKQTLRELTPKVEPPSQATWGPEYITKEEFGVNLFECVKTIAGIHTLRQQMNDAVHHHRAAHVQPLRSAYMEAKSYLANQLPTLTDAEMAQILTRYPDVVTL